MNAIETRDLTKSYGSTQAVKKLNLVIHKGELFSLLGMNGAGKTTTIKMLSGLITPTAGDAFLLGESIATNPQGVKAKLNVSPQETAVARNLTVRENLLLIAEIYGSSRVKARDLASQMLSTFQLEEKANYQAKTLSGGMQRRLSIAMAIISHPSILFLDEPTLGLDVIARRELWKTIEKLKGEVTIILTTHYLEEAVALSHRIGIMAEGELKAVGTLSAILDQTNTKNLEDAFIALATEGR